MNLSNFEYQENFDTSKISWIKIGNNIEYFVKIYNIKELKNLLSIIDHNIYKIFIIGAMSNTIFHNKSNNKKIIGIKLLGDFLSIEHNSNIIKIGSSVLDSSISQYCINNNIANLEFLSGIPGSIAGNIIMNAGCYNNEIKDYFIELTAIDYYGNLITLSKNDIIFKYRESSIDKNLIILYISLEIKLLQSNEEIIKKILLIKNEKMQDQISSLTLGSTFKNPPKEMKFMIKNNIIDNVKSWQLIDECGLRGFKIGNIQISEKHCNFLINLDIKNNNIENLIEILNIVEENIYKKFNFKMQRQILII